MAGAPSTGGIDMSLPAMKLIFIGSTGSGKTMLINFLLGCDKFDSRVALEPVTTAGDCKDAVHRTDPIPFTDANGVKYNLFIYNLPGLVETDAGKTAANKASIEASYAEEGKCVTVGVFSGAVGGRLREEEIAAFNAVREAYDLQSSSLLLVFNELPPERTPDIDAQAVLLLRQLTRVPDARVVFIETMPPAHRAVGHPTRRAVQQLLANALAERTPALHEKKKDIMTAADEVKEAKDKLAIEQQAKIAALKDTEEGKKQLADAQTKLQEQKETSAKEVAAARAAAASGGGGGGGGGGGLAAVLGGLGSAIGGVFDGVGKLFGF